MLTDAMKRLLTLAGVFVFCFALTPAALVNAQSLAGGALKANLDLPFDAGLLNEDGEDEDAPEIINFYSQQYEGDGIFYAIDRSGSMLDSGELLIAKNEVRKNNQRVQQPGPVRNRVLRRRNREVPVERSPDRRQLVHEGVGNELGDGDSWR